MNLSIALLIGGCVTLLLMLMTCFFGYKLARFLLPLSGLALAEGLLYIYVYDLLTLDVLSTWLFFGGSAVAVYLILFFFKRTAGFFTGLLGSAFFVICLVYALNLHGFGLLYPVALTLCAMAGLLTVAYKRVGVVISTSLLGGCAASFIGLYIYLQGVDAEAFIGGNLLIPLEGFLTANIWLVGGVALALMVAGLLVQFCITADKQVLASRSDEGVARKPRKQRDSVETWMEDTGY